MTIDALTPFRWLQPPYGDRGDLLGEIYCVTLVRGLDPAEVLRRFGARTSTQMSFAELELVVSDFTMVTEGGEGGCGRFRRPALVSRSLRVQRSQSRPPRSLPSNPQRVQANACEKPAHVVQIEARSLLRRPGRARS
ncbi:DUF6461 domain-containing protein [Nonomuraea sp. NPDC055795]